MKDKESKRYLELKEWDRSSGESGKGGFGGTRHGVAGNDGVFGNWVGNAKEGQRLHAHGTCFW